MKPTNQKRMLKGFDYYLMGYKQRDIAEHLGVPLSTLKCWKKRYWRTMPGDRSRVFKRGAPPYNKNAVWHGLYSKKISVMRPVWYD